MLDGAVAQCKKCRRVFWDKGSTKCPNCQRDTKTLDKFLKTTEGLPPKIKSLDDLEKWQEEEVSK